MVQKNSLKKVLIITGLTATGKSNFAISVAKKFNGEIISADSVQVFKGFNIGSNKVTKSQQQGITHHLIDIVSPDESFTVSDFVENCYKLIDDIITRGKLPIICGGTGLYIKALMSGYNFGNVKANNDFRLKYKSLAEEKGNKFVWDILNFRSNELASKVHYNNIKRVIRYLELLENPNEFNKSVIKITDKFDVLAIALVEDREKICKKIDERVDEMVKAGLFEEAEDLFFKTKVKDSQSWLSIGYRESMQYINKEITKEKAINLIKQHTRNYCKRQLTFLKTIEGVELIDITNGFSDAENKVNAFLEFTN